MKSVVIAMTQKLEPCLSGILFGKQARRALLKIETYDREGRLRAAEEEVGLKQSSIEDLRSTVH